MGQNTNIWQKGSLRPPFFDLKSCIESILDHLGLEGSWRWENFEGHRPFLQSALILKVKNQSIGFAGILSRTLTEANKIHQETACGELDLQLLSSFPKKKRWFQGLISLPSVDRDVSLLTPKNQPAGEILEFLKQTAPRVCKNIELVDQYEGKNLEKSMKSLSFRFTFQDDKKTLSEELLSRYKADMIEKLMKKWPVKIR